MAEYWYRYESRVQESSYYDEDTDAVTLLNRGPVLRVDLFCTKHRMLGHTPCGVRLDAGCGWPERKTRWVSATSRKRYAYPTEELALASFIKRKQRQIGLLKYQLEHAEAALKEARGDIKFLVTYRG